MNKFLIALLILCSITNSLHAKSQNKKFHIQADGTIGFGYDTNIFREALPLIDDFDYPSYQPEKKEKSALFDLYAKISFGYNLPKLPVWKKSKFTIKTLGLYSRLTEQSENSNLMLNNFYKLGIEGDWYIQFTGKSNNEGIYTIINNTYTHTKYNSDFIDDNNLTIPEDTYMYSENVFSFGVGYKSKMMPPIGFEYISPSRKSKEKLSNENYDYSAGPLSIKVYFGMLMAGLSSYSDGNKDSKQFDLYNSMLRAQGFVLRLIGEYFSREYDNYIARDDNGTLTDGSPKLIETRKIARVDLFFGDMLIAPIFKVKQRSGLHIHTEYYINEDNHEGYYNYTRAKTWVGFTYSTSILKFNAQYEYIFKTFDKRNASTKLTGQERRKDKCNVIQSNIKVTLNNSVSAHINYIYTDANSNDKLTYINYNKHYIYVKVNYFYDNKF